jgi:hypothetical protein
MQPHGPSHESGCGPPLTTRPGRPGITVGCVSKPPVCWRVVTDRAAAGRAVGRRISGVRIAGRVTGRPGVTRAPARAPGPPS